VKVLPALLVTALSAYFAYHVFRQWLKSAKQSHFYWTVSLVFSALASLFYCLTLWTVPHSALAFRLYYLFGALWMPSLMGLGSLALVCKRLMVRVCAACVLLLGLAGTILLFMAPIHSVALGILNGGPGVDVVQPGAWLVFLIVLNTFGAAAVFLVALWSIVSTLRGKRAPRFLYGNLGLACGIGIISAAGSAARLGAPALFWITMLVGWMVTFIGYRLLTPSAQRAV